MSIKAEFLSLLKANREECLSGEMAAWRLHCTRSAVWKAVKALRQEGYVIEAGTNRGYRLVEESSALTPEGIRLYLKNPETPVTVLEQTDSTNQELKRAALQDKPAHGAVLVSERQSAGRGRKGRNFYSPPGTGLYFSVLLRPEQEKEWAEKLTAAAAVAVCRAVEEVCGVSLSIKWVNDLYLEEKKVCGILTEAVTDMESGGIEFAVVGIGLNLYEPEGGFPQELQGKAGALLREGGEKPALRSRLTAGIVDHLLELAQEPGVPEEYRSRNLVPGREILMREGTGESRARALEVLQDGSLLIRRENGTEEALRFGDISLLP